MRDELSLLQAQLTYKKRLEAMLRELRAQQEPLQKKVAELEKSMLSEQKDVERLEGHSLAAFFYNVVGKKDEKLDAERQRAYEARIKHDAAARELESIEQDIESTEEDLQDLADCEARYLQAIERKRVAIESAGTSLSDELLEKERNLEFLRSQEEELQEAITAGTAALRTASELLNSLRSMENLGYLNRFGKNPLTDMARNETLDEAQKWVEQLQLDLQQFNKELSDVSIRDNLKGSIQQMLQFSDTFFDNLLTDATVSERIRQAHTQVDQALDHILGILRQLQTSLEEVRDMQSRAAVDVNSLIIGMEV